jgi:hypothetical protein
MASRPYDRHDRDGNYVPPYARHDRDGNYVPPVLRGMASAILERVTHLQRVMRERAASGAEGGDAELHVLLRGLAEAGEEYAAEHWDVPEGTEWHMTDLDIEHAMGTGEWVADGLQQGMLTLAAAADALTVTSRGVMVNEGALPPRKFHVTRDGRVTLLSAAAAAAACDLHSR